MDSLSPPSTSSKPFIIAVGGCAHSHLDTLYEDITNFSKTTKAPVSLFLSCGDFQSVRDHADLESLACPIKYRKLGDFRAYYSGSKKAPVPTIFIGGNHEASNYLLDLHYGGWVAPNIYFLGYSGAIKWRGLTIAGISGIHKPYDYHKGYFESYPFSRDDLHSIFHMRAYEIAKLKMYSKLAKRVNIFLSHEWPTTAAKSGDLAKLYKYKSFFKPDVEKNNLGARPLNQLVEALRPDYWFAAHLHCHYEASIPTSSGWKVNFSAHDKPIPGRKYLGFYYCRSYPDSGDDGFIMKPWESTSEAEREALLLESQEEEKKEEEAKVSSQNQFSYDPDYLSVLGPWQDLNLSDRLANSALKFKIPQLEEIEERRAKILTKDLALPSWEDVYKFRCLQTDPPVYKIHPLAKHVMDLAGVGCKFFEPMLDRWPEGGKTGGVEEGEGAGEGGNPEEMFFEI